MRVILRKLLLDFRKAKGKLLLLILAACLSGWGISSVAYGYFLTERDFEVNFLRTRPADMAVIIENYSDGLEERFLADQNVVDIERREVISARIKSSTDSWMPMILYAVDDLNAMRYDLFKFSEEADKVPGNIFIEQDAWFYLNEDQQKIEVLFAGDEEIVTWKVAGKVHDARQAPARMEGIVYAYSTSIEKIEPWLVEGRRRLLIKSNISSDKEQLDEMYERLNMIAKDFGGEIIAVNIPTPGKHIHQGIVDSIAFLQEVGGSILSVMGIVLLSLILLTWVYPQISDLGVMKAIGASTKHVFGSYALVLLFIVLAGLLIGMPLGYKTATLYNGAVAFFQNFEVVTALLPLSVHVFVLLIGLLIPLLFGILPLTSGAKTTVNDAMNKTFYVPNKRVFGVSQRLVASTRLKYGLNNLFRHSQRTMLTILLLAVGITLFFTASNLDHSIRTDLSDFEKTSRYEVLVMLPEEMQKEDVSFLDELPLVAEVVPINGGRVTYVPPTLGSPELSVARVLSPEIIIDSNNIHRGKIDKSCANCIYVCGEEMKERYKKVELGETIELTSISGEKRSYIFSGVINDLVVLGAPFFIFNDSLTKKFNLLAFELKPELTSMEILNASNAIDNAFIDNGINLRRRYSVKRRLAGIVGHLDPTFLIIKIMGIFTIVLGLFGLIIVLNLTLQERTREIGIMKSIGSPFKKISDLYNQEFVLISLIALVVGGLLAIPLTTALISVIAETVIRHPVSFLGDFKAMGATATVIVVVQLLLISIYNRFKMRKNARELLDHNF
jgi:putative ABC transport system permease protein